MVPRPWLLYKCMGKKDLILICVENHRVNFVCKQQIHTRISQQKENIYNELYRHCSPEEECSDKGGQLLK